MKSKGFTLIELAVVLAIIAVLAAVLTPMVTGYLDQARVARAGQMIGATPAQLGVIGRANPRRARWLRK